MKQGWEIKKLGDIAKFYRGLTYSKGDEVPSSTNMVLRSNNVDLETNALVYDDMKCLREDLLVDEDKKVKANSILICMSNGSKQHIGKVAYIQDDIDYAFGGFMGLIVPTKDIEGKYLYYLCVSHHFKHFLAGIGNGIGITNLRFSDLSSYCFSVPQIAEQEKIVAELDCLSGIIEKKKQQLKELDNLARSIFYEMFGDPVENDKGWEKKRLDEIGKVITGNTPSTKDESNYSSADYCFVKPSDIAKDSISYISNTEFYVSEKAYINSRQLPKGSVLTTCIGIIGKVGILQKDATCNQQINAIIPNKDIDAKFLAHVLFMIRDVLTDVANAPIVPIINKKEFSSVSIPVPLFSLQQDFASKIESIEKQKELIAQSIRETETLFNSRMDYYFN